MQKCTHTLKIDILLTSSIGSNDWDELVWLALDEVQIRKVHIISTN